MGIFKSVFKQPDLEVQELKEKISIYKEEHEALKAQIDGLEKRLNEEEKRVIPKGAQLLLFHLLGFGNSVRHLEIGQKQKGVLIGALLHSGAENAEKSLRTYGTSQSAIETYQNYSDLEEFLYSVGLNSLAKQCGEKARSLEKSKKNK